MLQTGQLCAGSSPRVSLKQAEQVVVVLSNKQTPKYRTETDTPEILGQIIWRLEDKKRGHGRLEVQLSHTTPPHWLIH